MSSTNRNNNRHKYDYYVTPQEEILKFLEEFEKVNNRYFESGIRIFDPCAGGDENHEASYPSAIGKYLKDKEYSIITNDIREDSISDLKGDYLEMKLDFEPDMIISNPPFGIIEDFVKKSLEDVKMNGAVVMLQRLNYFGSKKRNKWLKDNMPTYCFIHGKRMSFTDDGKTDSIEYAHFVWIKGMNPEYTRTYLLEF